MGHSKDARPFIFSLGLVSIVWAMFHIWLDFRIGL